MAYIGKQPTVGNFVKLDAITTSATTTFNLTNGGVAYYPQSANHCLVSLNGILQAPTDSFTISGSTIIFSSALTTSDVIDFIIVLGDVLNIGTPSDATITTAKLASGLVVPYGKGGTGLTTLGTANQVLAVNSGASALEFQSVSSDYVLLATTTVSSAVASVSFDGYFSSTYQNYIVHFSNIIPATTNQLFKTRYRRSNADVTTNNYKYAGYGHRVNSSSVDSADTTYGWNNPETVINPLSVSNNSAYGITGQIIVFNPLGTSNYKYSNYNSSVYYGGDIWNSTGGSFSLSDATTALSGISFYFGTGNISTGNFKLYGLK